MDLNEKIIELERISMKNLKKRKLILKELFMETFLETTYSFLNDKVSGFIDFYYACNDHLIL